MLVGRDRRRSGAAFFVERIFWKKIENVKAALWHPALLRQFLSAYKPTRKYLLRKTLLLSQQSLYLDSGFSPHAKAGPDGICIASISSVRQFNSLHSPSNRLLPVKGGSVRLDGEYKANSWKSKTHKTNAEKRKKYQQWPFLCKPTNGGARHKKQCHRGTVYCFAQRRRGHERH